MPSLIKCKSLDRKNLELCVVLHQVSFPRPWMLKEFEDLLCLRTTFALFATYKSVFSGFVMGMVCDDRLEILTIAVDPAYRQRGVATCLLKKILHKALSLNLKCIDIEVSSENKSAQNLYQKLGFVLTGQRKNYYTEENQRRVDAYLYRLTFK
tara:strand:+ start:2707 stop:3165 length:459 start_codon:yes stop_codon:yes gene_type:complete